MLPKPKTDEAHCMNEKFDDAKKKSRSQECLCCYRMTHARTNIALRGKFTSQNYYSLRFLFRIPPLALSFSVRLDVLPASVNKYLLINDVRSVRQRSGTGRRTRIRIERRVFFDLFGRACSYRNVFKINCRLIEL